MFISHLYFYIIHTGVAFRNLEHEPTKMEYMVKNKLSFKCAFLIIFQKLFQYRSYVKTTLLSQNLCNKNAAWWNEILNIRMYPDLWFIFLVWHEIDFDCCYSTCTAWSNLRIINLLKHHHKNQIYRNI